MTEIPPAKAMKSIVKDNIERESRRIEWVKQEHIRLMEEEFIRQSRQVTGDMIILSLKNPHAPLINGDCEIYLPEAIDEMCRRLIALGYEVTMPIVDSTLWVNWSKI